MHKIEIKKTEVAYSSINSLALQYQCHMMQATLTEKIESKRIVKSQKLFMILAVLSVPLIAIKVYYGVSGGTFQKIGYWLNALVLFIPVGIYLYQRKLIADNNATPFIEWQGDRISYKASTDKKVVTIEVKNIKSISIKMDSVEILVTGSLCHTINLADFVEYSDRIKIKANFEKMQSSLA